MTPRETRQLAWKILLRYQLHILPAAAPCVYLVSLVMGLDEQQALKTALYLLPTLLLPAGLVLPWLIVHGSVRSAFAQRQGDSPELRLRRILEIPRRLELWTVLFTLVGTMLYAGLPSMHYGKSTWTAPWAATLVTLMFLMLWLQIRLSVEALLAPYARAEFLQMRDFSRLEGGGLFWVRQKWYLPYAFGLFVVCTATMLLTVLAKCAYASFGDFFARLDSLAPAQFKPALLSMLLELRAQVTLPLALLGSFLVITAAVSAWRLAQQQHVAARAVQEAIEALASGNPKLPDWVSTDELGDLSLATAKAFTRLRDLSLSLGSSARTLSQSARRLETSSLQQTEILTRQASAIQETQVTAQEIKHTSELATQKAESVLQQSRQADDISRNAENTIERTVGSLEAIRRQVMQMSQNVGQLGDRMRQIANVTETVKGLADRSNMLAVNAAIEAVRSGEQGKGFAVVAREIRTLADQSVKATVRVEGILDDIRGAISTTVSMTESGSKEVEQGLEQVREFGDSIRQLSSIVRESGTSVRQISSAVSQQNAGLGEIFKAVEELSSQMEQTMIRLQATDEAMTLVRGVSDRVTQFVGSYGWQELGNETAPEAAHP